MSHLCGCELCERPEVEAIGTTHLGGTRFEVCGDCRTIVSQARGQIAQLSLQQTTPTPISIQTFHASNQPVTHWNCTEEQLPDVCPNCKKAGNVGLGSADGRPGCGACLYELKPEDLFPLRSKGPTCPYCKIWGRDITIDKSNSVTYWCHRCLQRFTNREVHCS